MAFGYLLNEQKRNAVAVSWLYCIYTPIAVFIVRVCVFFRRFVCNVCRDVMNLNVNIEVLDPFECENYPIEVCFGQLNDKTCCASVFQKVMEERKNSSAKTMLSIDTSLHKMSYPYVPS